MLSKVGVHFDKQLFGQLMRLQQMAEVQDRSFVRDRVTKLVADELAHVGTVTQHLLGIGSLSA